MRDESPTHLGVTERLARFTVETDAATIQASARDAAALSIFDWSIVATAGVSEPVGDAVRSLMANEGGAPQATALGLGARVPARAAALVNGVVSHALDYDDTHFDHIGHPSVAVLPAALALAEHVGRDGAAARDAFLIGAEVSCRLGVWLGRAHYEHGFHQTATAGAFGAAAAAARLLGLTVDQTRHAFGVVATRASGLKSQFGSMGKPLNAGLAASNGVEAAMLARTGFQSRPDGIECAQGFGPTHAAEATKDVAAFGGLGARYRFERVRYKHHACCHGLHAALEALTELRAATAGAEVAQVEIRTAPRWRAVCAIEAPVTGLEAKFSYRFTAAMALAGVDTAAPASFSDAICARPDLVALRDRVEVVFDPSLSDTQAIVRVAPKTGDDQSARHDIDQDTPVEVRRARLRAKAIAVLGAGRAERLETAFAIFDARPAADFMHTLNALSAAGTEETTP